jgi:hypothetical protein
MPDEIRPPLTPRQWRNVLPLTDAADRVELIRDAVAEAPPDFKRAAALCLYGQEFGFTRAMVDAIRRTAEHSEACALEARGVYREAHEEDAQLARRAADVIAALLPPQQDAGLPEPTKDA